MSTVIMLMLSLMVLNFSFMDKFSPTVCVFDELADVGEVDQFGIIDLRAAYINHSVPENVEISAESFNGVEDAQSLIGRASDVFDAIRKAEYVSSRAASADKAPDGAESTFSGTE